ncbi:MAG: two-component system, NarL family, sensor histidine kinase BarA [Campylobacterota bacterium]|nr:two-component system, NarL family, sensor histidine kinase BarA [Campylobacterota bacterium]
MKKKLPNLLEKQPIFIDAKKQILSDWMSYDSPREILSLHKIDVQSFLYEYADGVFDYFMGVISDKVEIGECPVMKSLLEYLKDRNISADEVFEICTHFRKAMIYFTYDKMLNSKELFDEMSFNFDKNLKGILKYYTDTIFHKEQ